MIKLETKSMTNAIATAKLVRPHVRRTADRTYSVTGRKGDLYTVRFLINRQGTKLGECNCKAGKAGMHCYHLASAAALNIALHSEYSRPSETPKAVAVYVPRASVARAARAGRDFPFYA